MKKRSILITFLSLILTFSVSIGLTTSIAYAEETPVEYSMGDANLDGKVNTRDAVYIKQSVVGLVELTERQKIFSDVNGDGNINTRDAVLIQQSIVGMDVDLGVHEHSFENGVCICGYVEPHTHNYSELKFDVDSHWYECSCGAYETKENHIPGAVATETTDQKCTECNYVITPALGHSFTNYIYNNDATCTENGTETATCDRNNCNETDTREKLNTKLGHNYGTPTYTWKDDKCTATRVCVRDSSHKETEIVTAKYVKDTDATCTAPEKGHYVATFTNNAFTAQTTATNSIDKGEKLGHSFTDYIYNGNATCTENGTETAICDRDDCNETDIREKANTALGHDWEKVGTLVVKCTLSGGMQNYKCSRCTATKIENVASVLSGAPDAHSSLAVGDICTHCGKEVLAKNGNSLVMKIDENNYQVEHYAGKAVGFSKYKDYIKSAYISDSVTEIGNDAFYNYSKLTSVEIPNSVTKIGNYVFYGCISLEKIEIPDSVLSLGIGVFEGCTGLKTLVLGNGLTEIKEGLLSGCSALENLTIPFVGNNVTETTASRSTLFGYIFGTGSFDGGTETKQYYTSDSYETYYIPTSLKSATVLTGNILYGAFYNCSGLTSITISNGVTRIGKNAFSSCSSLGEITLPFVGATKNGKSNTHFGYIFGASSYSNNSKFVPTSLKKVTIISTTSIGYRAFYDCSSLTEIVIPDSVTSIDREAFYSCSRLTSIEIPDSVTSIGDSAFYGCGNLTTVKYIGDIADWCTIEFDNYPANPMCYAKELYINNTLVTELNIPNTVTEIKALAFYNCNSLTSIEIPDSVTSIGEHAFYGCGNLTTVKYIGDIAGWCNISFDDSYANPMYYADELYINDILIAGELIIPDSVTSIGNSAFYNCSSLTSIEIPDGVTSIGNYAFYNCSSLTSVEIPDSVTSIGGYAFSGCSNLTSIEIPDNVTSIGYSTFSRCRNLTSIEIPDSVTSIGSYAFEGCTSLTSVVIGDSVTSIGDYAFSGCSNLTTVKYMGDIAGWCNISFDNSYANPMYYAKELYINNTLVTELNIPNTVTEIKAYAFYGCSNLTSVLIPDSVTSIGWGAFYGCSRLTSVEIPDSVTSIGGYAFAGCSSLTEITLPFVGATKNGTSNTHFGYIFGTYEYYYNDDYVPTSLKKVMITGDAIGNNAFYNCSNLTSVVIGEDVTSIGSAAFYNCSNLTSIEIPDNVTSIGSGAFRDCSSLTKITLPFVGASKDATGYQSVFGYIFGYTTSSGSSTISGATYQYQYYDLSTSSHKYYHYYIPTSLKTVVITGKTLPDNAFYNCSMIETLICDNVKYIGINALDGCVNLLPYNEYGNAYYWGYQGNEFYALIKAKDTAITYCIINDNTKIIADEAFKNCLSLKELQLPNGVTSIGEYAFYNCSSLTSIIIPDSVTSIGEYAFYNCSGLTKVNYLGTIDQWVQIEFGNHFANALYYETLYINDVNVLLTGTITINGSKIGSYAFYGCSNLTNVTISDGATSIGSYAFYGCSSLTSVEIPDSVTSIGDAAFASCSSLTSIEIPNSVESIGSYAFSGCSSLTSVEIPDSVTSIGDYAFYNCSSLTSIEILNSVTSIASYAFSGCSSLTSVEIPDGVTSIGDYAFYNCTAIEEINFNATNCADLSSNNYAFYKAGKNGNGIKVTFGNSVTHIPAYLFFPYSSNTSYSPKITSVVIGNSVTSIGSYAFLGCDGLTSVKIPDSVTSIGDHAFYNCSSLTSVVIGDSVTSIGSYAFRNCTSLTSVVIGDSVTSIGYEAFANCDSLTSVVIGDSVTSIGSYAFAYCSSLTSVEIGDGVTSIGSGAFYSCDSLTSVEIGDGVTSIGSGAFYSCDSLTSVYITDIKAWCNISGLSNLMAYGSSSKNLYLNNELVTELVIPNTVTEIKEYAFYGCSSLTSIEIPDSVTSIGEDAFSGCSSLTSVEIPDSVTSIDSYAFYNCSSLTSIIIPDSVTSIGYRAFAYCSSLTIYCEAESKPSGWDSDWNYSNRPVVWGHKAEEELD